ncbi:MAG: hypothetical protein Q7S22_04450 [Candidatus Micrarchaeota archaeon]|nr:hypothetical protein [Candidatus Micrarchaeota archaeon]
MGNILKKINEHFVKRKVVKVTDVLCSRKFNREPVLQEDRNGIEEIVKTRITNHGTGASSRIPVYLYWGYPHLPREPDKREKNVMLRLEEINLRVKEFHKDGLLITVILTSSHAVLNGMDWADINRYDHTLLHRYYFFGSGTYMLYLDNPTLDNAKEKVKLVRDSAYLFREEFEQSQLRERLVRQAGKWYKRGSKEEGALLYYTMRKLDAKEMDRITSGKAILFTYNDREYKEMLPNLPTLYLYSHGTHCEAPWTLE